MARASHLFSFLPASAAECRNYFSKSSSALFIKKASNEYDSRSERNRNRGFLLLGLVTVSTGGYLLARKKTAFTECVERLEPGKFIEDLPVFTESEVAKHKTREDKIWVTFKNGVYDVTSFVSEHPGGNKILLAAGSSLEPFWALYNVHHKPEVYQMLEQFRIGNIKDHVEIHQELPDYYENEPNRHPVLRQTSLTPFNAEPPPSLLVDNFYTPNELFFVRNHLPVPVVDVSHYRLEISGVGIKTQYLTLDDIKKFPKYTISSVVQCAGNRRAEMATAKKVKGLPWTHAAIGNATWSGTRLIDVLKSCGLDLDSNDVQHVHFEGLDKGPDNVPYGASIPSEKALNRNEDVLLAYEMNGKPLSRDHGFPLRVVVPGVVGARNVKWVSKIVLSDKESPSHWQQSDYKGFSPSTDWNNVDYTTSPAIQELPVTSAICMPENGEKVRLVDGHIVCKGYAYSGGGSKIIRVDVTADQGETWHVAYLEQTKDKSPRHWSWSIWSVSIPVPENQDTVEIWAKAVDSSYNTQPENYKNIWNLRGVLGNAYHRIEVKVERE